MIEFIIIGIIAACLTHLLNYCIGKPGSKEFSPYEIFSGYSIWLAKRRLKEVDLYQTFVKQYNDNLLRTNKKHEVISLKNDFKKIIFEAAEPYFTWERAVGICPICTGFWVSVACATLLAKNIIDILIIIVISHITIRLLSKIL